MNRRLITAVLGAVLGAVLWLLVVGMLSIRAEATTKGGVIDWRNQLDAVTDPGAPWLPYLAIGLLSAGVAYGFARAVAARPQYVGLAASVAAVMLGACAAWALASTRFPNEGGIQSSEAPAIAWLRWGGLSPATFAVAGGLVVLAVTAHLHGRGAGRAVSSPDGRDRPSTPRAT